MSFTNAFEECMLEPVLSTDIKNTEETHLALLLICPSSLVVAVSQRLAELSKYGAVAPAEALWLFGLANDVER
jgi:hypothetical protein